MQKKLIIIVLAIVAVFLIVKEFTVKTPANDKQSKENWQALYQGMHFSEDLKKINISTDVISVRIEPSLDDQVHLGIESNLGLKDLQKDQNLKLHQTHDELSITIKSAKKKINIFNWNKTRKVELYLQLPPAEYEEILLATSVGTISHTQVHAKFLELTNDVGEIHIKNSDTQQVTVKNSVGAIKMSNVTGRADVKNSTGLVEIHFNRVEDDVQVTNDIGSVRVTMDEEPENIQLDLSTDLGSIDTNLSVESSNDQRKTVQGYKGTNGPKIKAKTDIGKIEVNHI